MNPAKFVYVTYIRCTPEKLWEALITPEFNRLYWFGGWQESSWEVGADWKITFADGFITDSGTVVEIEPLKRIVLSWRNEFRPELKAEGLSRCTFEMEQQGDVMKLSVTHVMEKEGSKFIEAVSGGWPSILSGLKTLLETGAELPLPRKR